MDDDAFNRTASIAWAWGSGLALGGYMYCGVKLPWFMWLLPIVCIILAFSFAFIPDEDGN